MKIKTYSEVQKFQEGGVAPAAPAAAPAQDQAMQQIAQMAQEIISQLGPEGAAMLAQAIMEILQSQAPVGVPEEEVAFQKCGGKIKKKARKMACGSKVAKCGTKLAKCGGKTAKC